MIRFPQPLLALSATSFEQVAKLDDSYPGGLTAYIQNARQLLADSRDGKNPFEGYTPSVGSHAFPFSQSPAPEFLNRSNYGSIPKLSQL